MDYKCHCGASLEYSSGDGKWLCPMGHTVYLCKNCQTSSKSTPLQWIQQYQRWYCYECRQYAPLGGGIIVEDNSVPEAVDLEQAVQMYLIRLYTEASSGGEMTKYSAEARPLPVDRNELKEHSKESRAGLLSVESTRYYVVVVDNTTQTLWIWDQIAIKGVAAKLWTMSHRDADLPRDLIARTLRRNELESYKYRQIFRGNEPPEFWNIFDSVH